MRSETQIVEKQKTATGTGRKREKSEQTLAAIVNSAMDLTARHGLQNLALGDIAKQLGISKSGVFVRVGSLEALQLLVVDECERQFRDMVLIPTLSEKPGLPQVDAVVRLWIAHGGSMKALLGAHYESQSGEDVSELGRRLQSGMSNWRKRLEGLVAHAVKLGQLRADTDVFTTFEGDNHVLLQLVAKGLLTDYAGEFEEMDQFGMVRFVAGLAVVFSEPSTHRTVQLKASPKIYNLAFHRAVENGYWTEPHATVNRDFTKVLFNSNWGVNSDTNIDAYMIELPANVLQ